jgi:glyoxylase I family protein
MQLQSTQYAAFGGSLYFSICHTPALSNLIFAVNDESPVFGGLHHCGVLVKSVAASKDFYLNIFGFADESYLRPSTLPYPGAFLKCGAHQIHLMELPNPDEGIIRPSYPGRDRHIALSVNSVDLLKRRLDRFGVKNSVSSSGRKALFCRDLDDNGFEFVEDPSVV